MANEKNLKVIRSTKEAREKGRKGGVVSGKTRRGRKAMREVADVVLSLQAQVDMEVLEQYSELGIEGEEITQQFMVVMAQVKKALAGDTRAAEFLRDLIGEKPTNRVDVAEVHPPKTKVRITIHGLDENGNSHTTKEVFHEGDEGYEDEEEDIEVEGLDVL